jgi:hypothetical protein
VSATDAAEPDEPGTESVLRLAADIYTPFGAQETRRLRGYIADVEELVGSTFFQPGEQKLTLSAELGGPLQSSLTYPGEEAVRAVVGLFRQLYNHHEATSYHQILKLLSRHAPSAALSTATLRSPNSKPCANGRRRRSGRRSPSSGSTHGQTAQSPMKRI